MKKAMIYFLLLAGTLLLAGCQKEGRSGSESSLIKFTAGARPETKTAYGVSDYDANNKPVWQRIDWQLNDKVRIFSPEAADRYHSDKHYADYRVVKVTPNGRESEAEIINSDIAFDANNNQIGVSDPAAAENDNVNGLVWGDADTYTFYGTYPVLTGTVATTDGTPSATFTGLEIKSNQDDGDLSVNMPKYGYLTAAKAGVRNGANVRLEFEPAFTAFEVTLEAETDAGEITITGFELVSGAEALAGEFSVSYAGITRSFTLPAATDANKVVGISFPANTTIKPASSATATDAKTLNFTVFALPQNLTNLTLRFYVKDGDQTVTRSLKLTKDGSFIPFTGCKKHRIYGIAMPDGMWRFKLDPLVEEWEYLETNTSYSENVQAKAFSIEGALETGNHYEAYDTGTNTEFKTFEEWNALSDQATYNAAHPTYYEKYYQLRTLDMSKQTPYFEIKFTPMAPYAGYWNLSAEAAPSFGNTSQGGPEDGFRIVLYDGETEQDDWDSGQIMNMEVVIRIYPKSGRDLSKEYCMLLTGFFSPNKNGEPTHSADSELQDVHGDGRYSYWKFVIPATQ